MSGLITGQCQRLAVARKTSSYSTNTAYPHDVPHLFLPTADEEEDDTLRREFPAPSLPQPHIHLSAAGVRVSASASAFACMRALRFQPLTLSNPAHTHFPPASHCACIHTVCSPHSLPSSRHHHPRMLLSPIFSFLVTQCHHATCTPHPPLMHTRLPGAAANPVAGDP
jgi:hypothetical protein